MQKRQLIFGVGLAALPILTLACQGQPIGGTTALTEQAATSSIGGTQTLCGADDMQEVEQYDGTLGPTIAFVNAHQGPVFSLKWKSDLASRYTNPGNVNGSRWCTGTMLSNDIAITAGHCFDIDGNGWTWPRDNATGQPITSAQGALEMLADFNYQLAPAGNPRTTTTVGISQLVEYRLGGVDYSVIRLTGNPGATFGKTTISPFSLQQNDVVAIIQHPAGQTKQIHAGPVVSFSGNYVSYATADTLGGSSGSGVLNPYTGYISAVHTNGGCTTTGGANSGVVVSSIYPVSPVIQTLSLDTAKIVATLM